MYSDVQLRGVKEIFFTDAAIYFVPRKIGEDEYYGTDRATVMAGGTVSAYERDKGREE